MIHLKSVHPYSSDIGHNTKAVLPDVQIALFCDIGDVSPSSQETLGDNRLQFNCLLEEVNLLMAIRCKTCV